MDSQANGIEASYNACGVIAHMMSDGPYAWTIELSREEVLKLMTKAIKRWPLKIKRNINYR